MKLSEIKGEAVLDVIADLIAPISNIAIDKEASELFSRKPLPANMTVGQFMLLRAQKAIPKLLKEHKNDVIDILSTLAMEPKEEYLKKLTIAKLISDTVDVLTDECIAGLFFSARTNEAEETSGSARENTEEGMPEDLSGIA